MTMTSTTTVRRRGTRRRAGLVALVAAAGLLTGCLPGDVVALTDDALDGRNNGSPGAATVRSYLVDQLRPIARGANTAASGDAAYLQTFATGTNVVAVVPGTDLADRYVVVGAHYDGLGACASSDPNDDICNGATDNATGVAIVLRVARELAERPGRRSVVIALWDGEEDGLLGSRHFTANPLVPLANVEAYVNYDIQGANLLPNLRTSTFALGAETGGPAFVSAVSRARGDQVALQTSMLSSIFGQGRSDHVPFLTAQIPSIFYSDSTGPCYHTAQDDGSIVDYDKLRNQATMATTLVRDLASTSTPPDFVPGLPLATYDDAVALRTVVDRAWVDRDRFSDTDEARVAVARTNIHRIVTEGRAAFDNTDLSTMLNDAVAVVAVLTHGPCDGFLPAN